jgi:hypothetical protein
VWRGRAWQGDVPDLRYGEDAVGWEGDALGLRQNGGLDVGRKRKNSQLGTEETRQTGSFPAELPLSLGIACVK